jgi:hypothetical protein
LTVPTEFVVTATHFSVRGVDEPKGFGKIVGLVKPSRGPAGEMLVQLALVGIISQLLGSD